MAWTKSIPKTIKVGARDYSIVLLPHRKASQDNIYGRQNAEDGTIELDDSMTEDNARIFAIHEVMHAIYANQCMYNVRSLPPQDQEEFIVDNMSKGFAEVLKNNPKFLNWIKW